MYFESYQMCLKHSPVGLSTGLECIFENKISLFKLNNEQDNIGLFLIILSLEEGPESRLGAF